MNKKLKQEAINNLYKWAGDPNVSDDLTLELTKKFQKEYGLTVDGIIGPMTYSRLDTWVESQKAVQDLNYEKELQNNPKINFIINREFYSKCHNKKEPKQRKSKIERIVTHWDAALNADSCIKILLKRAVSTHFVIDNDGTVIQLLPVDKIAYHASGHNDNSIGIDISNAYYLKYQDWYTKNYGKRPEVKSTVHHSTTTHLGYYPSQIEAYRELVLHLCEKYGISVNVPLDSDGKLITTVIKQPEKWKGIMCHYHLTTNKIDCQGLELDKIFCKEEE